MAKKKAKKRKRKAKAVTLSVDQLVSVTATIAITNPPADLMVGFQIDSRPLTMVNLIGRANVSAGLHTASWGVVSPTVKPLPFGVTIVAADGRVLLNRPNERTGPDGFGVGADMFTA